MMTDPYLPALLFALASTLYIMRRRVRLGRRKGGF